MSIDLVFGGDGKPAAAAADEPGEGERLPLRTLKIRAPYPLLHDIELSECDDRLVASRMALTVPDKDSGVERIAEYPIDAAQCHRLVPAIFGRARAQTPLIASDFVNAPRRAAVGKHEFEHLAHERITRRVRHDRSGLRAVQIAERRPVGAPAFLNLGPVAALHVLRKSIDVIF